VLEGGAPFTKDAAYQRGRRPANAGIAKRRGLGSASDRPSARLVTSGTTHQEKSMPVTSCPRPLAALAVAILALSSACGSSGSSDPVERVVVADGYGLRLASVTTTGLAAIASATIPSAGLLEGHNIFGILKHPRQPWLYTLSLNECFSKGQWCWGNGRIDRFTVSSGAITWAGVAFLYDTTATLAPCALSVSSYAGQVGRCAPVDGVFNADGTRLYVQNDDDDNVDTFSVDPVTGALTHLAESASTGMHGLALDPAGTYLYNGSRVLDVSSGQPEFLLAGTTGNDTTYVDRASGPDLLYSTASDSGLSAYSLADPAAPSQVATVALGSSAARACVATDAALTRFVTVGFNVISTVGFDGAALTIQDQEDLRAGGAVDVEGRGVAVTADGRTAIASWFQDEDLAINPSGWKGGADVFSIASDGALTRLGTFPTARSARAVLVLMVP